MKQRSRLISALRSEIMGPEMPGPDAHVLSPVGEVFRVENPGVVGNLFWRPDPEGTPQELVFFARESPGRKYGAGRLWPQALVGTHDGPEGLEDRGGFDPDVLASVSDSESDTGGPATTEGEDDLEFDAGSVSIGEEDFDVSNTDVLHPASMAVTLCAQVGDAGGLRIKLPRARKFAWQSPEDPPFDVNGRYAKCELRGSVPDPTPAWRRTPALPADCSVLFPVAELRKGVPLRQEVPLGTSQPLKLFVECAPRPQPDGILVVTVVLRNASPASSRSEVEAASLYQAHFEVAVEGGAILPYPENPMPFDRLDADEQSLALLYRGSKTWAIGHGCAAGWDLSPDGSRAIAVYSDAMPAVELPSMTPDVTLPTGEPLRLSMQELSKLDDDLAAPGWTSLRRLVDAYDAWLQAQHESLRKHLVADLQVVGARHLDRCGHVLARMRRGLELLRSDAHVRAAFRMANASMLLQQVATKQLRPREMTARGTNTPATPGGPHLSPLKLWRDHQTAENLGHWRAFQAGFLLMSLEGATDPHSQDRDVVDLIWFPTGGGKTEAYLGVMAVHMFHQRLLMAEDPEADLRRDGTNVLMRYTLRMLTTQQFQRAASLICAMEMLRRDGVRDGFAPVPGGRFSLGLWLGSEGSPNKVKDAEKAVSEFKSEPGKKGNPMVLTECPWCRCAIGVATWKGRGRGVPPVVGISTIGQEGPLLHCPDPDCSFGGPPSRRSTWLPIEVIDERIYAHPPSLIIATADKFAMMAYRPQAGAILGREITAGEARLVRQPPGLIIQDELHLIAGPLGTIYGLYEAVIEDLCTAPGPEGPVRPKRIASTATIRGAEQQVRSIFGGGSGRAGAQRLQLFPSPGLGMEDSFFGRYARDEHGVQLPGRLYLGLHGNEYGSVLTAQVRAFSRVLMAAAECPEGERDPWWTLLAFYNSIRELGGAHTLVQSDIRARLKFLAARAGVPAVSRRTIAPPHELTSRRTQAEIVGMLDGLAVTYDAQNNRAIDICLASNIIEVGVDIDRLSLMAVVGQPKTTAQYIQVTGRVGRRWMDRPGLVLTLYNPMRSRDRSHYEQFHSYHNRLYERVEPTTATPFSPSAIDRAAAGAALLWARQHVACEQPVFEYYREAIVKAFLLLEVRCREVEREESVGASVARLFSCRDTLLRKLEDNPQSWEEFPPKPDGEYLMLWPGQSYRSIQLHHGVVVPSAMRQVDQSAELEISDRYVLLDGDGGGGMA